MRDFLSIGTNRRESMIGTGIGLGLAGYRLNPPGGPLPALDLWFSQSKSLSSIAGPTPSFSRASSGTYFDASGVLQSAGVNAARFNHVYNGTNWVSKGLLVEEQRTNSAQYSEDFSNAFWIKSTVTVSANQAASPDGNTSADLIYGSSTGSARGLYYSSPSVTTISVFAKASGKNWITLTDSSAATSAWFNLSTGAIGTVGSGYTASIQNCGNGWYRCSLTKSTNFSYFQILLADSDNTLSFTANGNDGILLWGAQAESGLFPTSYIPNLTTGSTTRSADVCQITGSDFSGFWNGTEGSVAIECDRLFVGTADNWLYKFNASAGVDNINHQFFNGNDYSRVFYSGAPSAIDYGASSSAGVISKFSGGFSSSGYVATKNGLIADTKAITTIGTGHNELIIGNGGTSASPASFWNGHIARLRYWNTRLENGTLRVLST